MREFDRKEDAVDFAKAWASESTAFPN